MRSKPDPIRRFRRRVGPGPDELTLAPPVPLDTMRFAAYPHGRRSKGCQVAQSFSKARFLTVQEVAELMRVSSMTVYRLIKAGDLPAVRVGRSFRVRDEDVDAYLESKYTQAG